MPRLKEGVKILIVNPDGTVAESIDVGGTDLNKRIARVSIMEEVIEALEKADIEEGSEQE